MDRRTDMKKLIVGVRNFANTPKIHQAKQFMVARHKDMNMELNVPSKCLFSVYQAAYHNYRPKAGS